MRLNPKLPIALGLAAMGCFLIYSFLPKGTPRTLEVSSCVYRPSTPPAAPNPDLVFGLDLSHYQGVPNWVEIKNSHHPIEFIFVRATMGVNGKDKQFDRNWKRMKEAGYIRGAYHYFRPNENAKRQFRQFARHVKLEAGDFPPVLDIETLGRQSTRQIQEAAKTWLSLAEAHYGVKPIVYTSLSFYRDYLKGHVDGYPLWIAAYTNGKNQLAGVDWTFHQFTDQVRVSGICEYVDGNDFNGRREDLLALVLPIEMENL